MLVTPRLAGYRQRSHINCWTDAAGAEHKVVVFCQIPGLGWKWTLWEPSEELLYDILLERGDHQIGFQEFAGVLVSLETSRSSSKTIWSLFGRTIKASWVAYSKEEASLLK